MPETSPVPSAVDDQPAATEPAEGTFAEQIEKVIEKIRPAIQADQGDIFLRGVDADQGKVTVELVGACVTCPASTQTLKAGIERILKDRVEGVTEVVNAGETTEDFMSETTVSL